MARVLGPRGPTAPRPVAARERFQRAAGILAHVCGLTLLMKRYIEKSRAEEWAQFYLSIKNHSANELLFDMSNFSKYNLSKDFSKLKTLMFIQPKQRSQENLQEIQLCLKKNRSFHILPNEVQLQLCQTAIYQELEAESMLLRQGHVPLECYLILAGHLTVMSSSTSMNKNTNSEILSEFEEGDFIGEICLLTNTNRPASILCKTDVKLLVISKDTCNSDFMPRTSSSICHYMVDFYCILAPRIQEQYQETHSFLRSLPLFFSWPKEKTDFLVHCSLHRYYRAGPTIISDFNSHFLVFIISGRCRIIAQINCAEISVCPCVMETGSSALENPHAVLPRRVPLDVTGGGLETATVSPRTSFSAARKKTLDTKKPPLQMNPRVPQLSTDKQAQLSPDSREGRAQKGLSQTSLATSGQSKLTNQRETKGTSSATCFVEIRVLEQGEVFGLAEALGSSCDLHLYLISEGVECIFIPKNLFLEEASTDFRRSASELVCPYPTEEALREHLVKQQVWNEYKARLLAQQLKR